MKNRERILLLAEFAEYGGTRTYFKQLINYLFENNYIVFVALTEDQLDEEIKKLLISKSFRWIIIDSRPERHAFFKEYFFLLSLANWMKSSFLNRWASSRMSESSE